MSRSITSIQFEYAAHASSALVVSSPRLDGICSASLASRICIWLLAVRGQPGSNSASCGALARSHERHHLWKVLTSTASSPSLPLASLS
jgi:hypothetical protein